MERCETLPEHRPAKTDHIPITTVFDVGVQITEIRERRQWNKVVWEDFRKRLTEEFAKVAEPKEIDDAGEFWTILNQLDAIVEAVIQEKVPQVKPSPNQRRWWTSELTAMKKVKTNLENQSYRKRAEPDHPAHEECRRMRQTFSAEIKRAKADKWVEYMEEANSSTMWGIGKMVEAESRDGGRTRIPDLVVKDQND